MFREGYYIEVIKAKYSAATAVITIKEKTIDIKGKKVTTNKWLTLDDWASLYDILEKALLQNSNSTDKTKSVEKRKFTRHLEIAYTFEENTSEDRTSLPTIRVLVSGLKRKSSKEKSEKNNNNNNNNNVNNKKTKKSHKKDKKTECSSSDLFDNNDLQNPLDYYKTDIEVEEYIPDNVTLTNMKNKKNRINDNKDEDDSNEDNNIENNDIIMKDKKDIREIGYVPSRKSTLELLQQSKNSNSNEYVPSVLNDVETIGSSDLDALYVPNSIPKYKNFNEIYEPSSLSTTNRNETETTGIYIPNSKGLSLKKKIDEYQPDFIARNKTMKFDNSYVPTSTEKIKELKKNDKIGKLSSPKSNGAKKFKHKEKESANLSKKNSNGGHNEDVKREM